MEILEFDYISWEIFTLGIRSVMLYLLKIGLKGFNKVVECRLVACMLRIHLNFDYFQ